MTQEEIKKINDFKYNFEIEKENLVKTLFEFAEQDFIPLKNKIELLLDSNFFGLGETTDSIFLMKYRTIFKERLSTEFNLNMNSISVDDILYKNMDFQKNDIFNFEVYFDYLEDFKDTDELIPILVSSKLKKTFKITREEFYITIYEYIKNNKVKGLIFGW